MKIESYSSIKEVGKKDIKLYNVLFPIWFLIVFPMAWVIIMPANFVIDSMVVLITLKIIKSEDIKNIYKKSIFKVWIFGFISDFIGVIPLFIVQFLPIDSDWWYDYLSNPIAYNPFDNWFALIYVICAIVLAGVAIYFFNYKISFKKLELPSKTIKTLALSLAIFTAPYVILYPSQFMYSESGNVDFFTNHIISSSEYKINCEYLDESGEYTKITPSDDTNSWQLRKAVNTGKRIKDNKIIDLGEPMYKVNFYGENKNAQGTMIEFWIEEKEVYFKYKDKGYQVKENRRSEVISLLKQIN